MVEAPELKPLLTSFVSHYTQTQLWHVYCDSMFIRGKFSNHVMLVLITGLSGLVESFPNSLFQDNALKAPSWVTETLKRKYYVLICINISCIITFVLKLHFASRCCDVKLLASNFDFYLGIRSVSFNHNVITIGTGVGNVLFYDMNAGKYRECKCGHTCVLRAGSGYLVSWVFTFLVFLLQFFMLLWPLSVSVFLSIFCYNYITFLMEELFLKP